ncbi:MAG: DNA alkylation repair protein [Candidatus Bathyarchaeia archaeon]
MHRDVIEYLEGVSDPEKVRLSKRWDRDKDYETYGLSASDYADLYEEFDPRFLALDLDERLRLADRWAKSDNSTLTHLGIHLLGLSTREGALRPAHFGFLDEFLESFRGWGSTDMFCGVVLQPLLEVYADEVLDLLRRWNASESPWKRRASVVAFTRRTARSGRYIDVALSLCDNLIRDEEDLVRKGVGWALKDNMRADKERILAYVKSLRRMGVSSTITLYAIRDLKGEERQEVLSIKPPRKRRGSTRGSSRPRSMQRRDEPRSSECSNSSCEGRGGDCGW